MTIRPGTDWGSPGPLAPHARICRDDAEVASALQTELDAGEALGGLEVGLVGGDLHRTLGSPRRDRDDLLEGRGVRYPVDVGVARFDSGPPRVFVAHLIGSSRRGRRWWHGPTLMVMNTAFAGTADLAPRSHPNDGRLDVIEGSLPLRQRREARRRTASGSHVPHPSLTQRRIRSLDLDLGPTGLHVRLDGVDVGTVRHLRVEVAPDALTVVA